MANPRRGSLKVYLGAAPGVGKTYSMLAQAHEMVKNGKDVVVGIVETHGRQGTQNLLEGLEQIPQRTVFYRGSVYHELDVEAIIDRHPDTVLVDELAHTIVGADLPSPDPRSKRYHDVHRIQDAGINVISTVNIQHLESLNDVVHSITGQRQRETIPDHVLREADEIELVDLSPDALRIRLSRGMIYDATKVDAALSKYFRLGNLTALRELALLWLADRVDEGLSKYRDDEQIENVWPARERILVAVTGGPESRTLIRRGARIAGRTRGREVAVVHVVPDSGLRGISRSELQQVQQFAQSLGATWHTIAGDDIAQSLLEFARTVNATQLVLGTSRSPWWNRVLGSGVSAQVLAHAGEIDVHMVTATAEGRRRSLARSFLPRPYALAPGRLLVGWIAALGFPPLLTALFITIGRGQVSLALTFLTFITAVVFVAMIGGWWPAAVCAIAGSLLINWFFTPPVGTLTIATTEGIIAIMLFLTVAAAVAAVVSESARRATVAAQARAQAIVLSDLAGSVIREGSDIRALLNTIGEVFTQRRVTINERDPQTGQFVPTISTNPIVSDQPPEESTTIDLDEDHQLVLDGRELTAPQRRTLDAYAGRILTILHEEELARVKAEARNLAAANSVRSALLAAVSHDLRTPLAAVKASVSALRMDDVVLPASAQAELLENIEDGADRLTDLISNLLDMSRIQTGAVELRLRKLRIPDVIASALANLGAENTPTDLHIHIDSKLPEITTDFGLLERVIANLVHNAHKYAPGPVTIDAAPVTEEEVAIRVMDHGPGIPDDAKAGIFLPFKRVHTTDSETGLGLGLAVANGFVQALKGTMLVEDTPGGGTTMTLTLPISAAQERIGEDGAGHRGQTLPADSAHTNHDAPAGGHNGNNQTAGTDTSRDARDRR